MVIVQLFPFLKRNLVMRLIVKIMAENGDIVMKFFFDFMNHGTLAGTCSAGNSDYDDILHGLLRLLLLLFLPAAATSAR